MQGMLASLVFSMSVKDETFRAAMATNRNEVRKTEQDFDKSGRGMVAAMQDTARGINAAAVRIVDELGRVGDSVKRAGLTMTVGLSLPLGYLGKKAKDTASDFQSAMNLVHSAMVNASPAQLDKLREAALQLGPAFGKSSIEAAGAIESLAKSGMDASSILGGGLESALKLAVVGQADLSASAEATTDILAQFHMSASQLPGIVDKVTGALDASKMNFDDYRLAIGQMGGVAGGLGYSFDDMNAGLAATASYFAAGSDAGTSFKTFLTMLNPSSEQASKVMSKLGIVTKETGNAFFQANGQAKDLGAIAEVLRERMGNLSDRSLQDALTTMFGTDAMRTAIALMKEGSTGIADMQRQIESVTAQQKLDVLLDGEAAATQRLASAWQKLKIVVGEAGIIQAFTMVKEAASSVVGVISSAPPWFFKLVVATGALAASIGPLTLAAIGLAKIALPLMLLRLGPVALGFAAIINPAGVLLRLLGQLALQAGAATVIGRLGTAMVGFAGPIGLVIAALTILYPLLMRAGQASDAQRVAVDAASKAEEQATDIARELALATDQARIAILKKAEAARIDAAAAVRSARSNLLLARTAYEVAKANAAKAFALSSGPTDSEGGLAVGATAATAQESKARANYAATIDALTARVNALDTLNGAISQAQSVNGQKVDMSFEDPKKVPKTKKGRDTSADAEDYAAKLAEVRNAQLQAQADLTDSFEARYKADMDGLIADRASYARQLATDQRLSEAQRATLLAEKDREIEIRKAVAEQVRTNAKAQEGFDLFAAVNDAQQDLARATIDLTDSAGGRKDAELRLLDIQRQREEAELDLVLATKNSATAEWANADKRKSALDGIYAQRADAIVRSNQGPAEAYMRTINRSTSAINEDLQGGAVDALKGLNTGLSDALLGTAKLADAFENMGKRIMASLLDIAIQQSIIKPFANSLFGGSDGAGGGLFGSMTSLLTRTFGGGKATGGPIDPSSWYVVGEKGPEIFAPGVSGTVIPNGGRGAGGGSGDTYIDMRGAMVDTDVWAKVDRIASYRAGEAYKASASHTESALAGVARQRL